MPTRAVELEPWKKSRLNSVAMILKPKNIWDRNEYFVIMYGILLFLVNRTLLLIFVGDST